MGILTNLLRTAWDQENKRRDEEINRYSTIAQIPGIRPEIQNWAIDQLTSLAPKKAGGIKDIGGMFKELIAGQRGGQDPSQASLQQALGSTGRPPMSAQIPNAPGMPAAVPQATQQIAGVRPSLMLSPQEQLALKIDEFRQTEGVRNDLQKQLTQFQNEETNKSQLELERKRFEQQQKEIGELTREDPRTGKPMYSREEAIQIVTGKTVPGGLKPVPRPVPGSDPRIRMLGADPSKFYTVYEDSFGNVQNFFEAAAPAGAEDKLTAQVKTAIQSLKLAHPDWSMDRITQAAGRQVQASIGAGITQKEINAAVSAAEAEDIGIGTPRNPTAVPPAASGTAVKPANAGAPAVSSRVGAFDTAPIRPGSDEDLMNQYVSQILDPIPGARGGRVAQIAYRRGRRLLMARTGLGPYAIDAALQARRGTAKALQQAIQQQGAFGRLENAIDTFGDMVNSARTKVNDTGVSVLNRWLQAGMRSVPGDPDVAKLDVAVNALARTYSQVLAGGYQSKAMPPVSSSDEARKVIASEMQQGRIGAAIDQMKAETQGERKAMNDQIDGLYSDLGKPLGSERSGEGGGAGPLVKPPRAGAVISSSDMQKYLDAAKGDVAEARKRILADKWTIAQ